MNHWSERHHAVMVSSADEFARLKQCVITSAAEPALVGAACIEVAVRVGGREQISLPPTLAICQASRSALVCVPRGAGLGVASIYLV